MSLVLQSTARLVAIHRAIGAARRRRRVPRQIWPSAIMREYASYLMSLVDATRAALGQLFDQLPLLVETSLADRRVDSGEGRRVKDLIERARELLRGAVRPSELEALATKVGGQVSQHQREQLARQIRAALGVDVPIHDRNLAAQMEAFVAQNVAAITSVPEKLLGAVEQTIYRGFAQGLSHDSLAEQLEERFSLSERQAATIARDQVGSLVGQLNATRQRALGLTRFVWRTMRDDRVREAHEEREGKIFSYDDPPEDGLPGEPINCRCYAEPVFSDVLEAV